MKQDFIDAWIKEADAALDMHSGPVAGPVYQFAVSSLATFYGPNSPQARALEQTAANVWKDKSHGNPSFNLLQMAHGAIASTKRELQAGLIRNVRAEVEGEVIGDFLSLAKAELAENTEETKNVAAVLAAAAFEDALRRLASERAGVTDRPQLSSIVDALKNAGLLKGGQLSQANSLLKFRNDSMHADWSQVYRSQVEGCISFVDALLLQYFS